MCNHLWLSSYERIHSWTGTDCAGNSLRMGRVGLRSLHFFSLGQGFGWVSCLNLALNVLVVFSAAATNLLFSLSVGEGVDIAEIMNIGERIRDQIPQQNDIIGLILLLPYRDTKFDRNSRVYNKELKSKFVTDPEKVNSIFFAKQVLKQVWRWFASSKTIPLIDSAEFLCNPCTSQHCVEQSQVHSLQFSAKVQSLCVWNGPRGNAGLSKTSKTDCFFGRTRAWPSETHLKSPLLTINELRRCCVFLNWFLSADCSIIRMC